MTFEYDTYGNLSALKIGTVSFLTLEYDYKHLHKTTYANGDYVAYCMKLINRKTSDYYRNISTEEIKPAAEPSMEIKEEAKRDYTFCDKIVESLKLTDNMRVALECRMSGLSYPEIGRILDRAQSTVFEYFIKMRQRYTVIYG